MSCRPRRGEGDQPRRRRSPGPPPSRGGSPHRRPDELRRLQRPAAPIVPARRGGTNKGGGAALLGAAAAGASDPPFSFAGASEEKKEDPGACPATPTPAGEEQEKKERLLPGGAGPAGEGAPASPARTATTVVTSGSSPTEPQNPGYRGPASSSSSSYTALRDVLPGGGSALSPPGGGGAGEGAEEEGAIAAEADAPENDGCVYDGDAAALRPLPSNSSSSSLPIPPPARSALLGLAQSQANLAYYRVAYRGVVALRACPRHHHEGSEPSRSGAYLSYGDVFLAEAVRAEESSHPGRGFNSAATRHPTGATRKEAAAAAATKTTLSPRRRSNRSGPGSTMEPPKLPDFAEGADGEPPTAPVLRVVHVLTGGYANESEAAQERSGRAASSSRPRPLGYLIARSAATGEAVAEPLAGGVSLSSPPAVSAGPWTYRIVSASPVPVLAGPRPDAPRTASVLLPGTVHDVSLCYDNRFLRLQHRRGWFPAYRETAAGRVPVAELVAIEEAAGGGAREGAGAAGASAADTSMASHSTYSSQSTVNTSFASALSAAGTGRGRRHRPPRRALAQEQDRDRNFAGLHHHHPVPRQVAGGGGSAGGSAAAAASQPGRQPPDDGSCASLASGDERGGSSVRSRRLPGEEPVYLMRALHPKGIKILDSPEFAASNLVRGGTDFGHLQRRHAAASSLSGGAPPHRVFSTLPAMRSNPVAVYDSRTKTRRLPCGALFEARSPLQQTALHGEGLVRLLDGTGWAMVPSPADVEMLAQAAPGHEREWVRVVVRAGLAVACPPLPPLAAASAAPPPHSPSSVRTSAAESSSSDIASSVGSAILDVFRTPRKKPPPQPQPPATRPPIEAAAIPCGTMVRVEKCVSGDYARLLGGQGWIPTAVHGRPVCARLPPSASPEFRRGSFWFRVQAPRGVRVRTGPSHRAPSIRSAPAGQDRRSSYFRFECGEFLRASEVVTLLAGPASEENGVATGSPAECFCKLYRNRHVQLLQQHGSYEIPTLEAYTSPAEWVQVYRGDELFLEECAQEPRIERHTTGGWKYQVLQQVSVRKGPSFASESLGVLEAGDSVAVNERVAPPAGVRDDRDSSALLWLRLKDGQGWVHDTSQDTGEALLVPQSQRIPKEGSKKVVDKKDEIAYNAVIARLFHNHDVGAPPNHPRQQQSGLSVKTDPGTGMMSPPHRRDTEC